MGYAATEHGYQSDTVTISIDLAGEATTRRGLYVAVTRGREENRIHVITDSADVAEARDVLERILAVDRADIPAVTQRRQLAEQDHATPQPSRRWEQPGRCEIPEWFDQLRDQTRKELEEAEQRAAANAAKRERLETAAGRRPSESATGSRSPPASSVTGSPPPNDDVDHASRGTRARRTASRGLRDPRPPPSPPRTRRRREPAHLGQPHPRTDPGLDQPRRRALPPGRARGASTYARRCAATRQRELFERYTTIDRIPHLQERLDALDTWWRFANGDKIDVAPARRDRRHPRQRRRRPRAATAGSPTPSSNTASTPASTSQPSNPKLPASKRPASTSGCNDAAVLPPSPAVRRPDLDTQQVTRRVNRSA